MHAILLSESSPAAYELKDIPVPAPAANQVLVKVAYAGVNRADLFQLQGRYPRPSGAYAIPGLEVAGEVAGVGTDVPAAWVGRQICTILSEGAFAEYVCVPVSHLMPVPAGMSLQEAAAMPEACYTAWVSLVWQGKLQPGETALIHGGASGVGVMAVQIAKALGAKVFATAGSQEKYAACEALGAKAILHTQDDFVQVIQQETAGKGVDVILDMVGGDYLSRNLAALAHGGRLSIIAFIKGAKVEANLSPILLKHLSVMGSTLRARSADEKARIASELQQRIWPVAGKGKQINPMIADVFPLADAKKALDVLDKGLNIGKLVLKI